MQQFPHIRHDQCLVLLYYFHQKIMQKKLDIFKKRNFLDQALDFLPPRKPGLSISRVDFSSLNIMNYCYIYHHITCDTTGKVAQEVGEIRP